MEPYPTPSNKRSIDDVATEFFRYIIADYTPTEVNQIIMSLESLVVIEREERIRRLDDEAKDLRESLSVFKK